MTDLWFHNLLFHHKRHRFFIKRYFHSFIRKKEKLYGNMKTPQTQQERGGRRKKRSIAQWDILSSLIYQVCFAKEPHTFISQSQHAFKTGPVNSDSTPTKLSHPLIHHLVKLMQIDGASHPLTPQVQVLNPSWSIKYQLPVWLMNPTPHWPILKCARNPFWISTVPEKDGGGDKSFPVWIKIQVHWRRKVSTVHQYTSSDKTTFTLCIKESFHYSSEKKVPTMHQNKVQWRRKVSTMYQNRGTMIKPYPSKVT